ncbi:helix-turn-helix domain-containing protein [Cytobacillus spongiae]|jgi:XRE family transcriptional regulator of biofilm formation|uniref:helix-turn-helix domain-containing protein n=1 Tax=Cytobacillus spongiae TaxID=2901381 RepID=UPI001F18731B|nr:helix-turn-helix domain-containing protein [Cytobacillus spongiae]UII56510.1 helix-turn-helix domain-containing protein [Cytobacillus spongiae]
MVGKRIKQARLKRGYSINELAERAGVSKSYLSYIERGIQENPSLQVLAKLAKTLGTSVEELLGSPREEWKMKVQVDNEWVELIEEAIHQGVSKEEFAYYLDFIKFKRANEEHGK